jgi:hypothetical protein
MPSTHLSLHYHLVFSTKARRPLIRESWRERLHAYLGGTVRELGGVARAVGGTATMSTCWQIYERNTVWQPSCGNLSIRRHAGFMRRYEYPILPGRPAMEL